MRSLDAMTTNVKKAWQVFTKGQQTALAIIGFALTLMGTIATIRASRPQQQLGYSVVRRSDKVFDIEDSPRLRVMTAVDRGDPNSSGADGRHIITIQTHQEEATSWEIVDRSVHSFEIEIMNCGTGVLWHDGNRPNDAEPMSIVTDPPVRILDARVIRGDSERNGFKLERNGQWRQGKIGCSWKRLDKGEGVTVRVIYVESETHVDAILSGELEQCLTPIRMRAPKTPSLAERRYWARLLWGIAFMGFAGWIGSGIMAIRRWRDDRQILGDASAPPGLRPSLLGYWRQELLPHAWLLMVVAATIIWVVWL